MTYPRAINFKTIWLTIDEAFVCDCDEDPPECIGETWSSEDFMPVCLSPIDDWCGGSVFSPFSDWGFGIEPMYGSYGYVPTW
ncbi:MAG: hypothetical protein LBI54_06330, partial [Lachnospiraceae bacterium]|nr:hypothetical protein [Lachnospiraceae bacterium]